MKTLDSLQKLLAKRATLDKQIAETENKLIVEVKTKPTAIVKKPKAKTKKTAKKPLLKKV